MISDMRQPNGPSGGGASDLSDRRRNQRVAARFDVRFAERGQAARALWAYSLNLSVGGLCLRTRRRYEVGAALELELDVAGEGWHLMGEVAWVRDGAIGVRFDNVSPADRLRLQELVGRASAE